MHYNSVTFCEVLTSFNYIYFCSEKQFSCNLNFEGKMNKTKPQSNLITDLLKCYLRVKEYNVKIVTCEF